MKAKKPVKKVSQKPAKKVPKKPAKMVSKKPTKKVNHLRASDSDGDIALGEAESFVETLKDISLESSFPTSIKNRIEAMVDRLTKDEAVLTFGGHFKAGKSATLNAALGRSLLPSAQFPETGAICAIRRGEKDSATVCRNGSRIATECTTEAIQAICSLTDGETGERRDLSEVELVELRLQDAPISDTAVWLDSPGVNDDAFADDRAWNAAKEADVLIWILWNEHPLSECEIAFLQRHLKAKGVGSMVFVLNCFMREDTEEIWQDLASRQVPRIWKKVEESFADNGFDGNAPLTMLPISARAILNVDRKRFGGPEMDRLLDEIDSPLHPRVWKSRLHSVAAELNQAAEDLSGLLDSAKAENSRRSQLRRDTDTRAKRATKQLRESLGCLIQKFVSDWSSIAGAIASQYASTDVNMLKLITLEGPVDHGERLARLIREGGRRAFSDLCTSVEKELRKSGVFNADASGVTRLLETFLAVNTASRITPASLPEAVAKHLKKIAGASVAATILFHPFVLVGGAALAVIANQHVDRIRREVLAVPEWLAVAARGLLEPCLDSVMKQFPIAASTEEIPSPDPQGEQDLEDALNRLRAGAAKAERLAAEIAI